MVSSYDMDMAERKALNIVLIGMPGCGKTTVGKLLSKMSGMPFIDVDEQIERSAGKTVAQLFGESGEENFRKLETTETAKAGRLAGYVIATGGGVVTRPENYALLAERGRIYYIRRDTDELDTAGRPLSTDRETLRKMYEERGPAYRSFADCTVEEAGGPELLAEFIWKDFRDHVRKTQLL